MPTAATVSFTDAEIDYLNHQLLARLATAGRDGRPHVVPVSFRLNRETGTIDTGGLHVETTKKWRDVQANPWAAIVVDDLASTDPWQPRMLEIRGRAEAIMSGGQQLGRGFGAAFIRIHPERKNSFGIG
jgi:pyridoxamine 5'-phosphate oxidase family protein